MLADCGLRVGELLALRRDEQDLRGGMFRVSGSAWNGQVVASSREKRHDRVGPIPPGCLTLLRDMPVRIDSPWLFPTPGQRRQGKVGRDMPGGLLWRYENWMRDVWRPTRDGAGIDPTPQEFRRSYNSLLLAQGIDRADLADVLGHGVDVNADRYTQALRRSGDQIRSVIG
jgi:integrase